MTKDLYKYGLEVFNNEVDKFEKFLFKNKNKSEKELKDILDKFNYGNW